MNQAHHMPKTGHALVIVGAQGSGKSTMARQIAKAFGRFQELEFGQNFDRSLHDALKDEAKTVIVDGTPSREEMVTIKNMVTNPTMLVRRSYAHGAVSVRSPKLIICTGSADFLNGENRRFHVIAVDQAVQQ